MASVVIDVTRPSDCGELLDEMRESDRAECRAYGQDDISQGVRRSVRESTLCWTARDASGLVCVFGAGHVTGVIGSPWMLATDRLTSHQRELLAVTPQYIERMLGVFPILINYVHARNTTSVRWLRRLGFTVRAPIPFGPLGEPFHPFEMTPCAHL